MKKASCVKLSVVLIALTVLIGVALAASGSGWVPAWAEQLGLKLEKTPGPAESFSELKATVEDPQKLDELGVEGLKQGDSVTIKYAGNVGWKAQVGDAEIRPCLVRISTETGTTVTLSPERQTLTLKNSPPPYRGSMAKPPNG